MGKRLSAQAWLEIGLQGLTESGGDGVKLDALCQRAGKTRGSFYHHFGDHEGFITAMLAHWQDAQTDAVIREVETSHGSDNKVEEAKSERLHRLASAINHELDVAMRRFAGDHPHARAVVEVVDKRRVDFIALLYQQEQGKDPEEAQALARVEYAMFVGWQMLWPREEPPDAAQLKTLLAGLSA